IFQFLGEEISVLCLKSVFVLVAVHFVSNKTMKEKTLKLLFYLKRGTKSKAGKNHTVLRIDEIASPGSIRLRIRSLIESLRTVKGK
ncbi:MAG: hypothetical protein ACFNUT_04190, partial [Bacteroidota bacterium]